MPDITLKDVTMIYPFQKVTGLIGRKQKQLILKQQQEMPYTSNEGVIALQHFDCVFEDGTFTVILGPSGSGKSTLLRIIAGLERPVLGEVWFDDVLYNDVQAQERDVAMVFQNYSLYPNQTVYQNIAFPLEVKHIPREEIEEEVKKIAGLLRLEEKLNRLPQELSGGEKQRVAIARSLIRKPAVLLFDEPFSNLDVLMRKELRNELKKIHEIYKTTFIYVTHDQYDALYLAERIVILKDGIKQMDASAADVYNYPVNRFCAEFIGSSTFNLFEDIPVSKDGKYKLFGETYELTNKQQKQLGKEKMLDLGIRGTNLAVANDGVDAIIEYTEMIETDLILHAKAEEKEIILVEKMDGNNEMKYMRGQEIRIALDPKYFHLFNKKGERI
ncbi:MAG: ABC transporter ATP-binding protein [Erysipelotrichaceae bacterium]|nr:ABC transporter ATP-binding protein [Erysipelotrichaceae bacterium]